MQRKVLWSVLSIASAATWIACTVPEPTDTGNTTTGLDTSNTTSDSSSGQTTATTATTSTTDDSGFELTTGATSTTETTTSTTEEVECDPSTGACVCIKVATWGALGTYGVVGDGQDAIVAWLNENSTGDADYWAAKPTLTAEYLNTYDVILIQNLEDWAPFSADEKVAFETWVRAGGGVIALNGYSINDNEMANVNDLLTFTGLAYTPASDTANETQRTTLLGDCDYCYGSSVPQGGWVTTHPISASMQLVGAFHGRAVTGGTPVAQQFGAVLGATVEMDAGHVFLFHDEWVTYNSQWNGEGIQAEDDCRDPNYAGVSQECLDLHPANDFSVPQFWYNSIKWASGSPECFIIDDETIIR